MRRQFGVVVLGLMIGLGIAGTAQAQQKSPYAFGGDNAVFMNFIKPDKTADYEMLIQKVKDGLKASDKPERKQMAEQMAQIAAATQQQQTAIDEKLMEQINASIQRGCSG